VACEEVIEMPKYRVKEGQTVKHGAADPKTGKTVEKEYTAGQVLELEPAEAEAMPWAVEPAAKG
jgi:hypothetical protein